MDIEEEENYFTNKQRVAELKLFGVKDSFRLTEKRPDVRRLMNRLIRNYFIKLQSINDKSPKVRKQRRMNFKRSLTNDLILLNKHFSQFDEVERQEYNRIIKEINSNSGLILVKKIYIENLEQENRFMLSRLKCYEDQFPTLKKLVLENPIEVLNQSDSIKSYSYGNRSKSDKVMYDIMKFQDSNGLNINRL